MSPSSIPTPRSLSAPRRSAARGRTHLSMAGPCTGTRSPRSSTAGGRSFRRPEGQEHRMTRILSWTAFGAAATLVAAAALAQTPTSAPAAPAPPATPAIDRQAAFDGVVAAEKAFAKLTVEKGMREGFLAFLADDSIVFDPDPANGQQVWKGRKPSPAVLEWYPVHSEVSLAGDLGFNTG